MSEENPIWRLKYLPHSLNDICGREKTKERLKNIIEQRNFPHLMLVGAKGIGKTTIASLFAKEFLGQYFDANYKLIYANERLTDEERKRAKSDAYMSTSKIGSIAGKNMRTPAFIQVRVKPFVELKVLGDVPFKILIVKNFETLGSNQQGFRRLMEKYGTNCRMILITSKISGIIDPIISRCQLFLISQVEYKDFKDLIEEIAKSEALTIESNVIETLYKLSDGKLSKAIDLLQFCSISGKTIQLQILYENAQNFHKSMIRSLLMMSLKGNFPKCRDLARTVVSTYKYDASTIFGLLLEEIKKIPFSKFTRTKLIELIAEADFRKIDGLDDDIQISALLSKICLLSEHIG